MAYIDTSRFPARSSSHPAGLFARAWAAYGAARQRRAAVAALHGLDDRSLRDIGLDRSEIEWAVNGRNGRDRE